MNTTSWAFESVFEASPIGIVLLDLHGRVLDMNPAAERASGYAAEEVQGRPAMGVPEDQADAFQATRRRVLSGESINGIEVRRQHKDGRPLTLSVSAAPLRDRDGAIIGSVHIMQDVTATRQLEDQLRHAQKMDAVGRLAGGVAHDFNNILTAILGTCDLLLMDHAGNAAVTHDVEEIRAASQRAAALTRQLLTFSRKQPMESRLLRVSDVVHGLAPMLRRVIGEDVELVVSAAADGWPAEADPNQLEQVVINLAVNGRDAMPRGGCLAIETANVTLTEPAPLGQDTTPPGDWVMVTVSDTGHGMSDEAKAHLFEPFFTTKPVGRGTGLGLATVYGIVKQCGGHIGIASTPSDGTTACIYLPRARSEFAELAPATSASVRPGRGHEIILMVEDSPEIRTCTERLLSRLGYDVIAASSGTAALALLGAGQRPVDLVLTDVVLPDMSGSKLAARAAARQPGVRILFMSGHADDALMRHGVEEARAHFLRKPFNSDALGHAVRAALDGPAPARIALAS